MRARRTPGLAVYRFRCDGPAARLRAALAGGRLRVVQWSTGNIGSRSPRTVIEHPRLELVGVHVHSADKAGRDAGELIDLDPVGVVATSSIESRGSGPPQTCRRSSPTSAELSTAPWHAPPGAPIATVRSLSQEPDR
jgi:hypothetical protein